MVDKVRMNKGGMHRAFKSSDYCVLLMKMAASSTHRGEESAERTKMQRSNLNI